MNIVQHFTNIEQFETGRLSARKLTAGDFPLILPMYQNPLVMKSLGGVISENIVQERLRWNLDHWQQQGFGQWLWFTKNTKQWVGRAGLRRLEIDHELAVEVGYVLLPEFWNQGFATEMASAAIEIGFEVLKLNELVCFALIDNKPSQRVMQKLGFVWDRYFMDVDGPHVLYRLTVNDKHIPK